MEGELCGWWGENCNQGVFNILTSFTQDSEMYNMQSTAVTHPRVCDLNELN